MAFCYYLLWGLVFYPGVMTPDSIWQWSQGRSGLYDDWHPYLLSLFYSFTSGIWDSPFLPILIQILYTSFSLAFINNFLYKNIKQKKLVLVLAILQILSISNAIYTITLWKDIIFSISMVNLAFYCVIASYKNKLTLKNYCIFTFLFITIGFFRHNGIVFLVIIPLLFLIQKKLRIAITLGTISIFLYVFISIILFRALNVTPSPFWFKDITIYHGMANFYVNGTLTDNARANLESVLPKDNLNAYVPDRWDNLYFTDNLNTERFNSNNFWSELKNEFYGNALNNNFSQYIKQRLILIFKSFSANTFLNFNGIVPNEIGMKTESLLPTLSTNFNIILQKSEESIPRLLFWNLYPGLILALALSVLALIKRHYRFLIFPFILLIQIPFLFLLSAASDWRYLYFIYFGSFFTIPMYLFIDQFDKIISNTKN
jgi:hypothetical protein